MPDSKFLAGPNRFRGQGWQSMMLIALAEILESLEVLARQIEEDASSASKKDLEEQKSASVCPFLKSGPSLLNMSRLNTSAPS